MKQEEFNITETLAGDEIIPKISKADHSGSVVTRPPLFFLEGRAVKGGDIAPRCPQPSASEGGTRVAERADSF